MFDTIYDSILSSALSGVRKRPVFIVHFLFSLVVGSCILLVGKSLLHNVFYCPTCDVNYDFSVIILSMILLFSLLLYFSLWNSILENMKSSVPEILNNALEDIDRFMSEVSEGTLFEKLRSEISKISFLKVSLFVLSYGLSWVFGLYLMDSLLVILTGRSIFLYLTNNIYLLFPIAVTSFLISQLFNPWEDRKEKESSKGATLDNQYLDAFLERLEEVLTGKVEYKTGRLSEPIIKYLKAILALPVPKRLDRLFIIDLFQIPYVKTDNPNSQDTRYPGNIIEEMLKENPTINYKLEPFTDRCKNIPKTELPFIRNACWYRILMLMKKSDVESEPELIGHAMILVVGPGRKIKR